MSLKEGNTDINADLKYMAGTKELNMLFRYLIKKWWLVVIIGFIAGITGIIYASLQKTTYKSRLTFALDEGEGGGISSAISLAAQFGLTIGNGKDVFAGDNIIEIMKSRRMVEKTLLSVDSFENKPITFIEYFLSEKTKDSKPLTIHFPVGQPKATFTYAQDSLLNECYTELVKSHLDVDKPDRKYNIFEVNVTNENEKFTKDFTDTLVHETNNFYISICTRKAKQTLDILAARVASMKGQVNASIDNSANIKDENFNPAFSSADVPILKEKANIQVYSTAYAEMFKNLEIARYQYLKQIPLMQIIDPADYPMKKIKASRLKMAVVFSLVASFITIFIFWIIYLSGLKNEETIPVAANT